ncbi:HD domain-containing protein [Amycolatopsis rhizosphaerae]|uniref:HD domain-containing protein n=1 Tax=Amycolatopsis rhizosphaerae TaxID=2053003 RepID=A0A558C0X2_9PSEU|nr:HD domain-containing protein [Amycolatopsis rhizosphaerae]TVT42418.1 HD domain-containing protein [Amycolatopsis rhizosphaerae]
MGDDGAAPIGADGLRVSDETPDGQAEPLLADRNPLPFLGDRLGAQLTFLIEADRLKTVLRQSPLAAADRRENDAEHSWHLALMVSVLAEYADEPIDVGHTVQLVVVHDLVEIYAGDTPVYDVQARKSQAQREQAAAERLFALLPPDQAASYRALWDEFEARVTPEARFAKAMDRLQPFLLNWMAGGGTWRTPGVTADRVRKRRDLITDGSARLGEAAESMIEESVRRGWLPPAPQNGTLT